MTLSELDSYITFKTNDSTSSFTAAQRLASINKYYHKTQTMILQSSDGWQYDDTNKTDYPILTANLVAGQQDYTLPTSTLKIKRLEVKLDGTNWKRARAFDISGIAGGSDDTSVAASFSESDPHYDVNSGSLFLYPEPESNVEGGLKIWIARQVDTFTSGQYTTGTLEPGFDDQFHIMLALGAAYDYLSSKPGLNATPIWQELQDYELRLRQHYGKKNEDEQLSITSAYGSDYGE